MKQLWSLFLTIFIPTAVFALPVGNPWDASLLCDGIVWEGHCSEYCDPCVTWCDAWSVRIGFYGDYVFDRHLSVDTTHNKSTIHQVEVYTNAAYLTLNVYDRFDLFGTIGGTSVSFSGPRKAFASAVTEDDFIFLETETNFSWSFGLRGTIWECGCFGIGAETQFLSTRPRINFVRDENDDPQYGQSGERVKYREWQVGVGAAYKISIASCATSLVPYLAVKWSRVWMDSGEFLYVEGASSFHVESLENDRTWGYAVGVTLVGCRKMSLTVEGRFVDEKAIHINTQYRF